MMKNGTISYNKIQVVAVILIGCVLFLAQTAWAAEAAQWRGIYDTAMKWLNFFLLVFIIVKFGRTPLKNFLAGQKDIVAAEIKSLEMEKDALKSKIKGTQELLAESDIRFADLKEKIVRQAEKEKERILAAAKEQSRMMLNGAKQRVETRIQQAKASVMADLVDTAVAAAFKELPKVLTPEDDQKYLDRFMTEVEST